VAVSHPPHRGLICPLLTFPPPRYALLEFVEHGPMAMRLWCASMVKVGVLEAPQLATTGSSDCI